MQLLLVSLLSLISLGIYAPQDSSEKVYSSAEGLFSATMPGEPETRVVVTYTGKGQLLTHIVSTCDSDLNEYLVSWTRYDRNTTEFKSTSITFDRARDALVSSRDGKLLNETAISMHGYPARAFSFIDSDAHLVQARFYFVQNRFYQVMAGSKSRQSTAAIEKFLDSFDAVDTK